MLSAGFPNTYTYTKGMAERSLEKNRGNIPVVIYRPSIVAAALKDPYPGWIDSLSAAAGVMAAVGAGVVDVFYFNERIIFDLVPVDYVVHGILVSCAFHAGKNEVLVINNGSS